MTLATPIPTDIEAADASHVLEAALTALGRDRLALASSFGAEDMVIVDLPLSNMTLSSGGQGFLDLDNIHIKADACGGDVTVRSYAYLRISTEVAHTQFAVYGDPIKI